MLDKVCTEDAELRAEELVLMEGTSCHYEKRYTLFSHELCFCNQLSVQSKKEKKMFARELVSIENLERSEQGASGGIRLSDAIKASELMINLFDSLFDSFSPSVLAFFVDIP